MCLSVVCLLSIGFVFLPVFFPVCVVFDLLVQLNWENFSIDSEMGVGGGVFVTLLMLVCTNFLPSSLQIYTKYLSFNIVWV